MNDEVNKEVATMMFKASKLTADAFAEAMEKFLKECEAKKKEVKTKVKSPDTQKHGKMTLKELMDQNAGATSIEIPRDGVGDFVAIAKKRHVDFAVKKDKFSDPPTYMCFFKAKDMDVIKDSFKEFVKQQELKKNGPSFHKSLENVRDEMKKQKTKIKEKVKQRHKSIGDRTL